MDTQIDAGNLMAGEHPPVPTTRDGLLIEALRSANRVSGLLNELAAIVHSDTDVDATTNRLDLALLRRFSDCSGVHLFIAANNLAIDLPPDLQGGGLYV